MTRRQRRRNPSRVLEEGSASLGSVLSEMLEHGLRQGVGDIGKGLAGQARKRLAGLGTQAVEGLLGWRAAGGGPDLEIDPRTGSPRWFSSLLAQPYNIFYVLGLQGSGKTALAFSIAEARDKPIYMLDAPPVLVEAGRVQPLESIAATADLPPGITIIIDDAAHYLKARAPMAKENLAFIDQVFEIRHRQQTLILTAQDSSSVDKFGLDCTGYFQKEPVMGWETTERPTVRKLVQRALSAFGSYPRERWKEFVYVEMDQVRNGLLHYSPPDWYTSSISKYRGGMGTGLARRPRGADRSLGGAQGNGLPQEYEIEGIGEAATLATPKPVLGLPDL